MTDFLTAQLHNELFDERPATAFFDGPQDAVITAVVGRKVWFTVPDFDTDSAFGPAAIDVGTPSVGDKIVVVFVGTGIDSPRVVSLPNIAATDVGVTPFSDISATDVQTALEQLRPTKAMVDALGVDADTLDGHDSTFFYSTTNPPPASGAMINQTVRGTIASTNTTSISATIPAVNTAKSQLRHLGVQSSGSSAVPDLDSFILQLSSATTITATRAGSTSGGGRVVSYELTEWT